MFLEYVTDNCYRVYLYDWDKRHDDYVAGYVQRDPSADPEDCDAAHWRFYAEEASELSPICAGDLKRLAEQIAELNFKV